MQRDISKQIGQATKWSGITEILTKLISPFVNMILARLLAPEEFGLVATITMVISFTEVFTDAGFQKYIVQHEFENQEELDKNTNVAFWTNFMFSSIICSLIFVFRNQIAAFVGSPQLGNSISVASISILLVAFSSIQMARFKREFDFKTLFYVRVGVSLIPIIITVPLAIILKNYWALLIGTLVRDFFSAAVLTWKSNWKPKLYYSLSMLKEMLSFSIWTLLESIAIWLTTYVDILIVGNYLNEHYLGLYKTAMTTVNSYMAIITSSVTPVVFSALSRYQNDDIKFKNTYYTFQHFTALFVIPMGVGMFLFSDLVTTILLGSQWLEASKFMGLWGLTSTLAIIYSHFSSEVFRSKGQPRISLILQLIHIAFLVPTLMVTIKRGFEPLYTSRTLVRFQMIITAMLVMNFMYEIKITNMIKNTIPMIVSSMIMGIVGYGLQILSTNFAWQLFVIFICVVIYFLCLFLFFPKVRKEVLENKYVLNIKSLYKRKFGNDNI